jgi:hypothetical protein
MSTETKTESQVVTDIIRKLSDIDSALSEIVSDYQQEAECSPGFESHDKTDDGEPICLPEDANPDIDGVRVHIDEAMTELATYRNALDAKQVEQHQTEEQRRKDQEKNITETFGNNGQWHAELNIEYDGDDLVSWCHVSTTRNGMDYCSSLGVVESYRTVEGDDMQTDELKVPDAIYEAIQKWADENGY